MLELLGHARALGFQGLRFLKSLESYTHTDIDTDTDTHRHTQAHTGTHRHRYRHRQAQTQTGTDRHEQRQRETEAQAQAQAGTDTDRHRQAQAGTDTHRHTDTDTDTDTHRQTQTEIDTDTDTDRSHSHMWDQLPLWVGKRQVSTGPCHLCFAFSLVLQILSPSATQYSWRADGLTPIMGKDPEDWAWVPLLSALDWAILSKAFLRALVSLSLTEEMGLKGSASSP
jgi:hypothetical protein